MTLVWSGLAVGAIYALVTVGYNVVFISSGTFNFANGALIMLGTYIAYWGLVTLHLTPVLALLLAAGVVGVVAVVEERVAFRTVTTIDARLITAVGVATLIEGVSALKWGGPPLGVPFFGGSNVVTVLGGRAFPVTFWLIGVAVVLTGALYVLLRKTMLGIALLAISETKEAASVRGINVRALAIGAFAASGVIAGALGLFVGPHTDAVTTIATKLALFGFVALAIGGFGSLPGGLIGGLAIGMITEVCTRYLGASYGSLMVFAAFMLVLLVRPGGLFATVRERVV